MRKLLKITPNLSQSQFLFEPSTVEWNFFNIFHQIVHQIENVGTLASLYDKYVEK